MTTQLARAFLPLYLELQQVDVFVFLHGSEGRMRRASCCSGPTCPTDLGFSFTQGNPVEGPCDLPGSLAVLAKIRKH